MMSALSTKDAPQEMLDAQQVSLVSTGASGAYLHGLEDEFLGNSTWCSLKLYYLTISCLSIQKYV